MGLKNGYGFYFWVKNRMKIIEEGGLAGSNLARNRDKSSPFLDPINQGSQGFLMAVGHEQKPWIGGYIKWLLGKTEELFVHNLCSFLKGRSLFVPSMIVPELTARWGKIQ